VISNIDKALTISIEEDKKTHCELHIAKLRRQSEITNRTASLPHHWSRGCSEEFDPFPTIYS
jgi:hypothetical protein